MHIVLLKCIADYYMEPIEKTNSEGKTIIEARMLCPALKDVREASGIGSNKTLYNKKDELVAAGHLYEEGNRYSINDAGLKVAGYRRTITKIGD